jgi:predicted CoA-substrate-specific enzyme activase
MAFVAGLDIGSRISKAVLIDESRCVLGKGLARTRPLFAEVAREALQAALAQANVNEKDLSYIATTGFGRYSVPFRNLQITDITCGGRGAAFLFPDTACVLDIGSQSTRAMRLRPGGKIREFRTNDKCAAGAGGFIERAARYVEVGLEDVGRLSAGMVKALEETIAMKIHVPADPEFVTALGAALLGLARVEKLRTAA